jgi:hypothetical protein
LQRGRCAREGDLRLRRFVIEDVNDSASWRESERAYVERLGAERESTQRKSAARVCLRDEVAIGGGNASPGDASTDGVPHESDQRCGVRPAGHDQVAHHDAIARHRELDDPGRIGAAPGLCGERALRRKSTEHKLRRRAYFEHRGIHGRPHALLVNAQGAPACAHTAGS